MAWCGRCGAPVDIPLPVEPLYDPETAAALVPMTRGALMRALSRHRDQLPPPFYRKWGRNHYRMVTPTEIRYLRALVVTQGHRPGRHAKTPRQDQPAPVSSVA